MKEETEIAGIVNKIHPFTLVLFWMRDKSVYGIYKLGHGNIAYFKLHHEAVVGISRDEILQRIHVEGDHPHPETLGFDQFVEGMKTSKVRRVWVIRKKEEPLDAVFLTMKELRDFLRLASP